MRSDGVGGFGPAHARFLPRRPRLAPEMVFGADRLATEDELFHARHESADAGREVRDGERVMLPQVSAVVADAQGQLSLCQPGSLALSVGWSSPNLLIVGGSGAGKTYRLMVPLWDQLVGAGAPVVIVNTKGVSFTRRLQAIAQAAGRECTVLSFTDASRSVRWNPLRTCTTVEKARMLAMAMCLSHDRGREGNDSRFWVEKTIEVITSAALVLRRTNPRASLIDLRNTISTGDFRSLAEIGRRRKLDTAGLDGYIAFCDTGSHNAATCQADLSYRTASLDQESLRAVLGGSELSLSRFVRTGGLLIVEMDEQRVPMLEPIAAMFVGLLFDAVFGHANRQPGGRLTPAFYLMLNELPVLGRVPHLGRYLNTARERGVRVIADAQSLAQFADRYHNEADSVLSGFQNMIALGGGLDEVTAGYVSRRSGTTTVRVPGGFETIDPNLPRPTESSSTWTAQGRPLLLPSEVARPGAYPGLGHPATVLPGDGMPPFYAFFPLAYTLPRLRGLIEQADAQASPPVQSRADRAPTRDDMLEAAGNDADEETLNAISKKFGDADTAASEDGASPDEPNELGEPIEPSEVSESSELSESSESSDRYTDALVQQILDVSLGRPDRGRDRDRPLPTRPPGWRSADAAAVDWWLKVVDAHASRRRELRQVVRVMKRQGITLTDLVASARQTGSRHLVSVLLHAWHQVNRKLYEPQAGRPAPRSNGPPELPVLPEHADEPAADPPPYNGFVASEDPDDIPF